MKFCPACGREIEDPRAPRKICIRCEHPIRRHDKYRFTRRGLEHRDCQDPELTKTIDRSGAAGQLRMSE